MRPTSTRASAPIFLRDGRVLNGALDPSRALDKSDSWRGLILHCASHRWTVRSGTRPCGAPLTTGQTALVDIAQGLLERGTWTPPSWATERFLAKLARRMLGWRMDQSSPESGQLGFVLRETPSAYDLEPARVG